jgi:hypothetical protein
LRGLHYLQRKRFLTHCRKINPLFVPCFFRHLHHSGLFQSATCLLYICSASLLIFSSLLCCFQARATKVLRAIIVSYVHRAISERTVWNAPPSNWARIRSTPAPVLARVLMAKRAVEFAPAFLDTAVLIVPIPQFSALTRIRGLQVAALWSRSMVCCSLQLVGVAKLVSCLLLPLYYFSDSRVSPRCMV